MVGHGSHVIQITGQTSPGICPRSYATLSSVVNYHDKIPAKLHGFFLERCTIRDETLASFSTDRPVAGGDAARNSRAAAGLTIIHSDVPQYVFALGLINHPALYTC